MPAVQETVEHRGGNHIDASLDAVVADQRAAQPGEPQGMRRIGSEKAADDAGGRMRLPLWWPQPGDAASFLIDHEDGFGWKDLPERGNQSAKLCAGLHVAAEQNESGRGVRRQ